MEKFYQCSSCINHSWQDLSHTTIYPLVCVYPTRAQHSRHFLLSRSIHHDFKIHWTSMMFWNIQRINHWLKGKVGDLEEVTLYSFNLIFISTNIFVTKRIIKFLKLGLIICLVKKNQELSYILASPLWKQNGKRLC